MEQRLRVGEYLDLEVAAERWRCHVCNRELGSVRENYKYGLLVHERDPAEVHPPIIKGSYTFSPNPNWVRILEFYCPGCGTQVETQYLPPGHPITNDTEIDIDSLKRRLAEGEIMIEDGRIRLVEK